MRELFGKIEVRRLAGMVNIVAGRPSGDLQAKTVTPTREQQIVTPDQGFSALSRVTVEAVNLQDKTVAPGTSAQVVQPDDGSVGLGTVTVEAAPLQQKAAAISDEPQTITPDPGYYGLDSVTLPGVPLQEKTATPSDYEQTVTPDEGVYGLSAVKVGAAPLQEAYVNATTEEQEIVPDEGFYGFSKIYLGAAPEGGGGSGGDYPGGDYGDWEPAEDTTFGDETVEEEVETGLLDYTGGKDENASMLPGIPGGEYKILFSKKLKPGTSFTFTADSSTYTVSNFSGEAYIYGAWGWWNMGSAGGYYPYQRIYRVVVYSSEQISFKVKIHSNGNTLSKKTATNSYGTGYFYDVYESVGSSGGVPQSLWIKLSGGSLFAGGEFTSKEDIYRFIYGIPNSADYGTTSEKYIAFGSATQILYDGSNINNVDGSAMTIYECDAADANTWTAVGSTGGGNYPVGGYTLIWNSHDLLGMDGTTVTQEKSDDPIAETVTSTVTRPVDRNDDYLVNGNTMNDLISIAQKITGTTEPLTPEEAKAVLEEYYANLNAGGEATE